MLIVTTWLWGTDAFSVSDVLKLRSGVARHLSTPHRFILITDGIAEGFDGETAFIPASDMPLTKMKGCFVRLRLFDPQWQAEELGAMPGDRIVNIDLDTVIVGSLAPVFDRPESFVIIQHGNAANPCPFNGALMLLRAGAHPEVWSDFSVEAAGKVPFYEFPDDQGWIWHKLPDAAGWKCGPESGVYVFRKPGWPSYANTVDSGGDDLPPGAALVTFSGRRNPEKFKHLDWVRGNWVA